MDEILRRLTALEAVIYTLVGLHVIQLTIFVAMWSIVIQGRRPGIPQLFNFGVKQVRYAFRAVGAKLRRPRKIKNMGQTEVTPDIVPDLEIGFAKWIYKRIHDDLELDFRETSLELVMSEFGCPNKPTLQKLLARFDGLGILQKKTSAKNSTRKLARDGYNKLKGIIK